MRTLRLSLVLLFFGLWLASASGQLTAAATLPESQGRWLNAFYQASDSR
jgi:hypothetical protein